MPLCTKELWVLELYAGDPGEAPALAARETYFDGVEAAAKADERERLGWVVILTRFVPEGAELNGGSELEH